MTGIATEEFKMTELGPIPSDWEIGMLGSGRYFQILPSGIDNFTGQKKYLSTSSIQGWKIESPECLIYYGNRPSRANMQPRLNTVWFAKMIGTVKVYCFTESNREEVTEYILSTGFCGIRCKEDVDTEYLKFIFLSDYFNTLKDSLCSGATQRAINNDSISSITIAFPPLPEQKKIAYVLSTVQAAIEKTDAVIKAARELKKSLMRHLFTYGPVPVSEAEQVPLKETEIGPVPEEWEMVRLGEASELRKEAVEPTNKGLRYIGLEHMDSGESRVRCFGSESEVRSTKNRFYEGDILYGKLRPYLDKVAIMNFDGICSTDIMVITTPSNRVNADYLVNLLHLPSFLSFATSTMTGVNHPRTSWKALKPFMIPLPSLATQKQIAETLFTVDQKIETEENRKKALEELFKTLLNNLMTGKMRVNQTEVAR